MSIDLVHDKGYRQMFFIKVVSSLLHTLEAEPQLQNQSSQRQRGNLLPPSSGRSASTWNPAHSDQHSNVQWWSPSFIHILTSSAVKRKKKRGQLNCHLQIQLKVNFAWRSISGEICCFFQKEKQVVCMLHLALVSSRLVSERDFSGRRWMMSQLRCHLTFPLC